MARNQSIIVAALTYRRPEMLAQLLESLLAVEYPAGWGVRFLIVDNDPRGSAKSTVEPFFGRFEGALQYVVEPHPGIPFARNRALREANDSGAKLLAFIDDDSYPDNAWIRELVAHQTATKAALVGGPYFTALPRRPLNRWQRFLACSMEARSRFLAANVARLHRKGSSIIVSSGNWLADLNWLREHDVWFDPAYRESGGSDAAISFVIRAKGGSVAWCPKAIIYEQLPPARLSLRNQFTRHRQQAIVLASLRPTPTWHLVPTQVARIIAGLGLTAIPVFGRASFMLGVYFIGSGLGKLASLRGASSRLYARYEPIRDNDA